jgi:enterochelin esterase-like enzyme
VLEPQATVFLALLVLAFIGLMVWLARTRHMVFRVLAAVLAFLPAMVFGVAAVNRYFDYYQTWGALFSDLSGSSEQSVPQVTAAGSGRPVSALLGKSDQADARTGYLFRTTITGPESHLTREVYVYLPPQYFAKAYANYRFPAVELLHGSPGSPESWINVMDVIPLYDKQLAAHEAQPAVLVMPDTDGGPQYQMQCLNYAGGEQDLTFVGQEVPDWVSDNLRVQPPGPAWGIAGYSEGGYCAANIGLQEPARYGYAGSISGYFAPSTSQIPLGGQPTDVRVDPHDPVELLLNTPQDYISRIPAGVQVPKFWLGAGALDTGDVQAAESFRQLLLRREASVPLMIVPGGGHEAMVWRAALSPMLAWMTMRMSEAAGGEHVHIAGQVAHKPPKTRQA